MDYHIDAKGKRLGRLATEAAVILQGKHRPDYAPNVVCEDRVVIDNLMDIEVSGTKEKNKIYYKYTGYVGNLKKRTYEQVFAKDPRKVVQEAVRRMLPKNRLNPRRMKHLVFTDHE